MNAKSNAVTVAKELSADELTQLLQREGWAEKPSLDVLPRMKLDGMMLVTPDGGMYVYNPNKPTVPAMTVRIVRPPEEYFAIWIDGSIARGINRPDLEGTFSKNFIQPDPNRRTWPSDEVFDTLKGTPELADNDGKPVKASWKGDILLQIIPDDGQLQGDETIYVLTLSTTSLIEFKGASAAPAKGVVSDDNFITKLSKFAQRQEGVTEPRQAVIKALESLSMGGVAAEVRLLRAENKALGQSWSVVVFDPIHVEAMDANDQLTAGSDEDQS